MLRVSNSIIIFYIVLESYINDSVSALFHIFILAACLALFIFIETVVLVIGTSMIDQSYIWNTYYYLSINSARVTIAGQTTLIRIGNS